MTRKSGRCETRSDWRMDHKIARTAFRPSRMTALELAHTSVLRRLNPSSIVRVDAQAKSTDSSRLAWRYPHVSPGAET